MRGLTIDEVESVSGGCPRCTGGPGGWGQCGCPGDSAQKTGATKCFDDGDNTICTNMTVTFHHGPLEQ
jgi:hypothetical protein